MALLYRLPGEREALARARSRLDRLRLYPRPVRTDRVNLLVCPPFFRLPRLRRYGAYALHPRLVLFRSPSPSGDLVTHELCHVWQMQHGQLRVLAAWLRHRYESNPFEIEARRAVRETRPP